MKCAHTETRKRKTICKKSFFFSSKNKTENLYRNHNDDDRCENTSSEENGISFSFFFFYFKCIQEKTINRWCCISFPFSFSCFSFVRAFASHVVPCIQYKRLFFIFFFILISLSVETTTHWLYQCSIWWAAVHLPYVFIMLIDINAG